jgi:hypothetical protein
MGVLPHIRKLSGALGHFLVQITSKCGAQRIVEPKRSPACADQPENLSGLALPNLHPVYFD